MSELLPAWNAVVPRVVVSLRDLHSSASVSVEPRDVEFGHFFQTHSERNQKIC